MAESESEFNTKGFHHVTMVARDARLTLRFYRDLLGLSLVKRTVNFDLPSTYHLYFGDAHGSPSTLLTFFEWPHAERGGWGVGGVHHVALGVKDEAEQLKWKRWLSDRGVPVSGPFNRGYFTSIYFTDPDGQVLEIATEGPGFAIDEPVDKLGQQLVLPKQDQLPAGRDEAAIAANTHPEPVQAIDREMALRGIHHVTGHTDDLDAADAFYGSALGLRLVKRSINQDNPDILHYFWANYDGERVLSASDMTLFGLPGRARRAREGTGQTHHVAYRADNEERLVAWRKHLLDQQIDVTPIRDRSYFKSIYFHSPDGLLVEIATDSPGFAIDEDPNRLGEDVKLPPWLQDRAEEIVASLQPLD